MTPDDFPDVRRLLDAVPPPAVAPVDVSAVYAAAHDSEVRRARRWRRVAAVGSLLAASVMIAAILPKLEVRAGDGAFVVRWGEPAPVAVPAPPLPSSDPSVLARLAVLDDRTRSLAAQEAKLRELQDLIVTVAADVDDRDTRRRDQLATLAAELQAFERGTREQLRQAEASSTALYTAVFDRSQPPGGNP